MLQLYTTRLLITVVIKRKIFTYNRLSSLSDLEPIIKVKCTTQSMLIDIQQKQRNELFSGMIYPRGLPTNSTCLSHYRDHSGPLQYNLPLRSCNTMPQESANGDIEFFNTIVLQPHLKLVTDMGRGFHVRCRYKNREDVSNNYNFITNSKFFSKTKKFEGYPEAYKSDDSTKPEIQIDVIDRRNFSRAVNFEVSGINSHILTVSNEADNNDERSFLNYNTAIPSIHMKILKENKIAENVNIGDPLLLAINIEEQSLIGFHVTDCVVRDGLGWGEQKLIDEIGCPTDSEIMGAFKYSQNKMSASVTFPAHKFPYTTSVYYQCNVNLCYLERADCAKSPQCHNNNLRREKRQTFEKKKDDLPATVEVYSGLYVNENADIIDNENDVIRQKAKSENELCISQRTFGITVAITGLILMLVIIASVICLMSRRNTKILSNSGSSIYSGPYTNTAFSNSS